VRGPATQASPPAYSGVVGEDRHANDTTNRVVSVTTATSSGDAEQSARIKRYLITMAIRTACFVLMVVVDGWLRWVFLAGAAFLPYVAVVLANARAPRTPGTVTPVVPRADDVRYLQP
jgi:hypothetical protein